MKQLNIRILVALAFLMLSAPVFAQKHQVSGRVVEDGTGEPVIGAGVLLSSGGGTVTDYDGKYLISAKEDDTITFTSIGYVDVVETVGTRSVIDVVMATDNQLLEEVVVLGYTSQKKTELTSAVTTVSNEKLLDVTTPDVGNMLQGKVAGVVVMNGSGQPGTQADIRIRGTGSITAGAGPLYVVDGVAGGAFNPNDIETLTVLKDASATALYGAAASGGVIVITTKGAAEKKAQVELKASVGFKQALMGRFSAMKSEELYDWTHSMYSDLYFYANFPEELLDRDYDWVGNMFKTGVVQNYFGSVSGKVGKVGYYVSLDHYNEKGTLINTNFRRTAARMNLSIPIADRLTMNVRANYQKSHDQGTSSWLTLDYAYIAMPWDNPYVCDADGNPTKEILYVDKATRSDELGGDWYTAKTCNLLHNEQYNYAKSHGESFVGDLQLTWNVTDWLTLSSTNRYDSSNSFSETYIDPRTNVDGYGGTGLYENNNGEWTGWGTTNLAKVHFAPGVHEIGATIGWEYGEGYVRSMGASGDRFPAGQRSLSNTIMSGVSGRDYQTRSWALLGQAQYSLMGKYILTASIRYDETYKFAPKARGGFFPGVSAAWVASRENFLKNWTWLSLLKFRAGYGKTGNDNIEPFKYQDIYSPTLQYNNVVAAILTQQANPNLGWEEAWMFSAGMDATIINNINISIDAYHTINQKLLMEIPTTPSTGFFSIYGNVGKVRNMGMEFAVDGAIFNRKDFQWTAGMNIGFNKNKVLELPNHKRDVITKGGVSQLLQEGRDVYTWYMKKWAGVNPEDGTPQWEKIEADGSISKTNDYSKATLQVVGSASPLFSGGINTMVRYKGISLSINGNFVVGNKIYNKTREIMDSDGAYPFFNQMSHNNGLGWVRWDPEDESTWEKATHPQVVATGNHDSNLTSSRYLEDGSFFRLRNVTLSYDLPSKWIGKIGMSGARVYVSADNLLTISRFSGTDPEVRLDSDMYNHAGLSDNNYPVPRSVVFGIDVKF